MYVARLKLDGVRGFHGPRAVDLDFTRPDGGYAGWTVLAGRNNSGKTTLLRAIGLCLAGSRRASILDESLEDWVSEGHTTGRVEVVLQVDPEVDSGSPAQESTHRRLLAAAEWRPEQTPFPVEGRPPTELVFDGSPSTVHHVLWSSSPPPGWFYAAYGPFRRLSGAGTYERAVRSADRVTAMRTLFQERAALTEAVDWLVDVHVRRLEEERTAVGPGRDTGPGNAQRLLDAVLALLNDDLLPDEFRVEDVTSEGPWLRRADGNGPLLQLHRMSDGFRAVVTLVLDIVRQMHAAYGGIELWWRDERNEDDEHAIPVPYVPHPGVVLIDEVDAHLHVSWQQRIGEWLKDHFPAVQFIVTTHSPYVCQAADLKGLIRLPGPDEGEPPRLVEDELYRRVVYGTGDDTTLSDLFGLDSPYSGPARRKRRELVELEMAVVMGQADEEQRQRYKEIRDELSSSPVARVDEVAARLDLSRERDM